MDTVVLIFKSPAKRKRLKQVMRGHKGQRTIRTFYVGRRRRNGDIHVYWHNPTFLGFLAIQRFIRSGEAVLFRLDIALDFLANNRAEAGKLQRIVDRAAYLKHERPIRPICYRNTRYWCRKRAARNVASYSGKRSKVTGGSCEHLEYRMRGRGLRRGITKTQIANLPTSMTDRQQLAGIFFRAVAIVSFDMAKIGRALIAQRKNHTGLPTDPLRAAGSAMRMAMHQLHEQEITALCGLWVCQQHNLRVGRYCQPLIEPDQLSPRITTTGQKQLEGKTNE